MSTVGILVLPGGMRNAVVGGMLSVFEGAHHLDRISCCWTQSSGAQTTAAFMSGQIDKTHKIWVDELTSPRLCGWRSLVACGRFADVDHLVDHCCRDLDFELFDQMRVPVMVGVVNQTTATTEYYELRFDNATQLFKATCALPLIARPIPIGEHAYIDGGTLDPLPIEYVMSQVDRLVILSNRPKGDVESQRRGIERLLFPGNALLQRAFAQRAARMSQSWDLVNQLEAMKRVLVIAPPMRVASRLCRNPHTIRRAWSLGEEVAYSRMAEFVSFIK